MYLQVTCVSRSASFYKSTDKRRAAFLQYLWVDFYAMARHIANKFMRGIRTDTHFKSVHALYNIHYRFNWNAQGVSYLQNALEERSTGKNIFLKIKHNKEKPDWVFWHIAFEGCKPTRLTDFYFNIHCIVSRQILRTLLIQALATSLDCEFVHIMYSYRILSTNWVEHRNGGVATSQLCIMLLWYIMNTISCVNIIQRL